jgi:hypothetical protein
MPTCTTRRAAQGPFSKPPNIPSTHDRDALTVTDGTFLAGYICVREGGVFAFLPDGSLLGEYRTQQEAVRALPSVNALGEADAWIGRVA